MTILWKWVNKYSEVRISETVSMKEVKEMQKRLAQLEEENIIPLAIPITSYRRI